MAGSSGDQRRRRAVTDEEFEEGEFVAGPGPHSHSASDTEEYYNRCSSSESDDDEATSNARSYSVVGSNGHASSSSAAANTNGCASSSPAVAAAPVLSCPVCGKEFTSTKAVCGHMKVHALDPYWNGKKEKAKEAKPLVAVDRGWGFTGKRGVPVSRRRSVSPPSAEPDNSSTAIVAAEPELVLQPTPLANAATDLSSVRATPAKTDPSGEASSAQPVHSDATAVAVAGADPPTEAVVHQQAALPPAAPLPAAAGDQAPPVRQQRAAPPNPDGYSCDECGKWFRTPQALGGHVAGHKNRRLAAAGTREDDGAVPCRRGSKQPKKRHVCDECFAEFAKGVQLGGHKRKHYRGEPIVPKKKRPDVAVPQLDPADVHMADLSLALPVKADVLSPAPAVEAVQPAPSPTADGTPKPTTLVPRVINPVILFGVDIGLGVEKPTTTQDGSPVTKTKEGSPV